MARCQCVACGKKFAGVRLFDDHRMGDYGGPSTNWLTGEFTIRPSKRRCLTTEEVLARGMRLVDDIWHGDAMPADLLAKMRSKNS